MSAIHARRLGGVKILLGSSIAMTMLTACAQEGGIQVPLMGSVPYAFYESSGPGGDSAMLEGGLSFEGDCVLVRQSDGAMVMPIFPLGDLAWESGRMRWEGRTYDDGDDITLSGGYHERPLQEAVLPPGCSATTYFVAYADAS